MEDQKKEVMQATAAKIRYYRHLKGLSQEEVSFRANLNPAYLGQVERGLKCPTIDTLAKIARALEIPLPELVRFDTVPNSSENIGRLKDILSKIPEDKYEQVFKLLEGIVELCI